MNPHSYQLHKWGLIEHGRVLKDSWAYGQKHNPGTNRPATDHYHGNYDRPGLHLEVQVTLGYFAVERAVVACH